VERVAGLAQGDAEVGPAVAGEQAGARADLRARQFQIAATLAGPLTGPAAVDVAPVPMPLEAAAIGSRIAGMDRRTAQNSNITKMGKLMLRCGYLSPEYVASQAECGQPLTLPHSGGWLLERAGATCDGADGLTRFNRAWSPLARPAYLGRHVACPRRYAELCRDRPVTDFFPAYRYNDYERRG
jgi:hypothetical protein